MANVDHSWVKDVDTSSELDDIWMKHSIYMVPALIKDLNPTAYKPQIISFGPYHYGDEKLMPMEIHKRRALIHFLKRAQKPLEGFMSALEEVAGVLMDSYQSLDGRWRGERDWWMRGEREEFLRLMLVDGCFMLEVLRFWKGYLRGYTCDYASTDPIFSRHGMSNVRLHVMMDMLRIENQLPLLVLKKLVATEAGGAPDDDDDVINQLVHDFMGLPPVPSGVGLGLHPLHLYLKSITQGPGDRPAQDDSRQSCLQRALVAPAKAFLQSCPRDTLMRAKTFLQSCPRGTDTQANGWPVRAPETDEEEMIPESSAARLVEAGIRFRKSETSSLLDVRFEEDGVLTLPAIVVHDSTECLFLNLMAFERLHVDAGNTITSYVYFMDVMVDSAKDVAVLVSEGIIHNLVGTDEAVAELFNGLGRYVTQDSGGGLRDVLRSVNEYCSRGWNMWRAKMIQFFTKSPLANSVAAFVFLILPLTFLQTVYTRSS